VQSRMRLLLQAAKHIACHMNIEIQSSSIQHNWVAQYCQKQHLGNRRTSIPCLKWKPGWCHIDCQTVSLLTLSKEQLVLQAPAYQHPHNTHDYSTSIQHLWHSMLTHTTKIGQKERVERKQYSIREILQF
jgi:hypothetical protein